MFKIISICKGGGYRYCRTDPPHPRANAKGLYPLHRVLVENRLGRLLEPGEVVHHGDHNKQNDDPANLELMLNADHSRQHMLRLFFSGECGLAHWVRSRAEAAHCVHGHPFDAANTRQRNGNGRRACRACARIRKRRLRAQRAG